MLYPLKFKSQYKEKIWGGEKIRSLKNENNIPDKCGESWEVSGVQGAISVVKNGFLKDNNIQELIEIYMGELVGEKVFKKFGLEFPLLFKIIDADDDLSVQVHPDDEFAAENHNAYGKTEAWYILEAEDGSNLISGFNKDTNENEFLEKVNSGNLEDILNKVPVKAGEVYFIPQGLIHSIGKGIMLAEIQQTSDVTYRVYDYNRAGDRELHNDMAIKVLDFSKTISAAIKFDRIPDRPNEILNNEYFKLNFLPLMHPQIKELANLDSFIIYYCINGNIKLVYNGEEYSLQKGETVLVPAVVNEIELQPEKYSELLEIYIEWEE
jgi:mannose-6-phosphate isomerase